MGIDDFIRGYKEGLKAQKKDGDVALVVRCADCIYYNNKKHAQVCMNFLRGMRPNDFCSSGKRGEDGKTDNTD